MCVGRDLATGANFSEVSLRRCGAIGTFIPSQEVCRLDTALFPLFAYLLKHSAEMHRRGCWAIWPVQDYLFTSQLVLPYTTLLTTTRSFYCQHTTLYCVYAARTTAVLTAASANDDVGYLTQKLNGFFLDTTKMIQRLITAQGAMATYEDINICSQTLLGYTASLQAAVQVPCTFSYWRHAKVTLFAGDLQIQHPIRVLRGLPGLAV